MQIQRPKLRQLIKVAYSKCTNTGDIKYLNFTDNFQCILYNKDPCYVSDGDISIQAILPDFKKVVEPANPTNEIRTPFYNSYKDSARVFNCPNQMLQQKWPNWPDPYHPAFHFKDKQDQYKKQVLAIKPPKDVGEDALVRRWALIIVNVANTGFYAPILQIFDFAFEKSCRAKLYTGAPINILYESYISDLMHKAKTNDLRKRYKNSEAFSKSSLSEFTVHNIGKFERGKFRMLDAHNQKIKSPPLENYEDASYIYMGIELNPGMHYFLKKPLANTFKNVGLGEVNRHQNFFDRNRDMINEDAESIATEDLLNDSSDSEKKFMGNDSGSESDESDPLRYVYQKMLAKQKK